VFQGLLAAEGESHVPTLALLAEGVAQAIEDGLFVVDK
jgi:hypothetical protein